MNLYRSFVPLFRYVTNGVVSKPNVRCISIGLNHRSLASEGEQREVFQSFRTSEQDPAKHNVNHLGRIYTIPAQTYRELTIENPNLLPKDFGSRNDLIGEQSLLVRRPAVEIIGYLNQLKWDKHKMPKFVLWGAPGCGKSVTLAHLAHYCHTQNLIILNFGRISNWFLRTQETGVSQYKEGRIDHFIDSQNLLKDFLAVNEKKIENLKTHKKYEWSQREETSAGQPLSAVVSMGIDRPRFAADCLNVLMRELKLHCQESSKNCRVVTLIDGVNVIFEPKSYVSKTWTPGPHPPFNDEFIEASAEPNELSVIYNLKKFLVSDSCNMAVVATVDRMEKLKNGQPRNFMWWKRLEVNNVPATESDYPFDILTQEGWELFDPFIPVEVPAYNQTEIDSMIDYLVSKKYIREIAASHEGRQEIYFLTGRNPQDFMKYSNYW